MVTTIAVREAQMKRNQPDTWSVRYVSVDIKLIVCHWSTNLVGCLCLFVSSADWHTTSDPACSQA